MTWNVIIEREAQRNLKRFPERDRNRIAAALVAMQQGPFAGDVVQLRGRQHIGVGSGLTGSFLRSAWTSGVSTSPISFGSHPRPIEHRSMSKLENESHRIYLDCVLRFVPSLK